MNRRAIRDTTNSTASRCGAFGGRVVTEAQSWSHRQRRLDDSRLGSASTRAKPSSAACRRHRHGSNTERADSGAMEVRDPRVGVAHWGFDIYPEAAIAEEMLRARSLLVRALPAIVAIGLSLLRPHRRHRAVHARPARWLSLAGEGRDTHSVGLGRAVGACKTRRGRATRVVRRCQVGIALFGYIWTCAQLRRIVSARGKLRGEPISFCFAGRGNRGINSRRL